MMSALLGAAQLALLAGNIPLRTTLAPVLALTPARGSASSARTAAAVLPLHAALAPPARDLAAAAALHVFAFAGEGGGDEEESEVELLLAESEGDFEMGEWEEAWAA